MGIVFHHPGSEHPKGKKKGKRRRLEKERWLPKLTDLRETEKTLINGKTFYFNTEKKIAAVKRPGLKSELEIQRGELFVCSLTWDTHEKRKYIEPCG